MGEKESKYSKNKEYAKTYLKNTVEEFKVRVPKGDKAKYKKAAADMDSSLNQFVIDAMDEKIARYNNNKVKKDKE